MTAGDHFERVAVVYESLRTTDEAPVRRIGQLLPGRPVTVTPRRVTRCQICHRTVPLPARQPQRRLDRALPPGPSRSARPSFPVAGRGDYQRCPQMPPRARPPRDERAAEPGRRTPAVTERGRSMVRARM